MYGPAAAPPPLPSRPRPVVGFRGMMLRVLFASFPLWSLGLLAWVPSLRFAIIRRRPLDWGVFALAVALTVLYFVLLFTVDENNDNASAFAGMYVLLFLAASVVHAVLADRFPREPGHRHLNEPPGHHPYEGAGPGVAPPAYGCPPAGHPRPAPDTPPLPASAPVPPTSPRPAPRAPTAPTGPAVPSVPAAAQPPGPPPASARMRQVASELDELDAQLRKREGGR